MTAGQFEDLRADHLVDRQAAIDRADIAQAAETVGEFLTSFDPLHPDSELRRRAIGMFGSWIARNIAAAYSPHGGTR